MPTGNILIRLSRCNAAPSPFFVVATKFISELRRLQRYFAGAPVTQWVKRLPPGLAVLSLCLARGEIFLAVNGFP